MNRADLARIPDHRASRFDARWAAARRRSVEDRLCRLPEPRPGNPGRDARIQLGIAVVVALAVTLAHHLIVDGAGFWAHVGVGLVNLVVIPLTLLVAATTPSGPRRAWLASCALWAPITPTLFLWRWFVEGASVTTLLLPILGLVVALLAVGAALLAQAHLSVNAGRAHRARRIEEKRAALIRALS